MQVVAINCGSSSVRCAAIDVRGQRRVRDVHLENVSSYEDAVTSAISQVRSSEVAAVGHRVVHGGSRFIQPTRIDEGLAAALKELEDLAPLHNPPAIAGIRAAREALPQLPHVAVFDTAFHSTLPRHASTYALPADITKQLGIRRFGFHGLSHEFVADAVTRFLRKRPQELRIISCHLGNGSSITAVEYGCSVDTSMGMTPLEGLVMGTRAGDLDPGVLLHLLQQPGWDTQRLSEVLHRDSGLKGLTGTHDLRAIESRSRDGDAACELAMAVFAHRVRKYIGAYAAVMGGVDVIAFTGGIGENSPEMRARIAQRLEFLGAGLDVARNAQARPDFREPVLDVSATGVTARLLVVRTDEEMAIATTTAALLGL